MQKLRSQLQAVKGREDFEELKPKIEKKISKAEKKLDEARNKMDNIKLDESKRKREARMRLVEKYTKRAKTQEVPLPRIPEIYYGG